MYENILPLILVNTFPESPEKKISLGKAEKTQYGRIFNSDSEHNPILVTEY